MLTDLCSLPPHFLEGQDRLFISMVWGTLAMSDFVQFNNVPHHFLDRQKELLTAIK